MSFISVLYTVEIWVKDCVSVFLIISIGICLSGLPVVLFPEVAFYVTCGVLILSQKDETIQGFIFWFEPTDIFLASKPFLNKSVPPPTFISPNFLEFKKIIETVYPGTIVRTEKGNQIDECIEKGYLLAELIDNIIITLGKMGVMVIQRGGQSDPFLSREGKKPKGEISHRMYIPSVVDCNEIANVSGAGDCFASGFIAAMLRGETEERCIQSGFKCSAASLRCSDAVPKKF